MADNKTTQTTPATVPSGTVIATDEIGGVDYQRVKLACGPDGTATDVQVGGGTEAAALRVTVASDSTGVLSVDDGGGTISVDDGGAALTVDGTVTANAGTGTRTVAGDVAHDSADSGNPVKVGGKAFSGANLTPVADGDRADLRVDTLGRVVTTPYQTRGHVAHQATTITNSTSETTILTAGAAGIFHDLVSLIITNAGSDPVTVTIKDDTGGTTRATFALAGRGGGVFTFPLPLTQAAAADNWTATLSVNTVTVHFVAVALKNVA